MKTKPQINPIPILLFTCLAAAPARAVDSYWNGANNADPKTASNWNTQADGTGTNGSMSLTNNIFFSTTALNSDSRELRVGTGTQGTLGIIVNTTGNITYNNSVNNNSRELTIGSGGITINPNAGSFSVGTGAKGVVVTLAASQIWTNNGTGTLLLEPGNSPGTPLNLQANQLTIDGSAATTINRTITGSGTGNTITKNGTGALTLPGANTFTGTTVVNAGTVNIYNALALQHSVLKHVAGTVTTNATTLTLGGLSGSVSFGDGTFFATSYSGVTALAFNTASTTDATYSGNIADGAAGMTINKSGNGIQVLGGTNTYSGTTTVSAGKLVIAGDSSGATGTATVSGGILRLSGTFGGNVAVQAGGGLSGEGSAAGATTFTTGNLNVDATTGTELAANNLDISGGVKLLWDVAPAAPGVIDVLRYTGSLTTDGTVGGNVTTDFDLSNIAVSARAGSGVVTDNAGTIQVDLGYANRTWNNNAANGLWEIGSSLNWVEGDNLFYQGDFVTFGDTGAGTVTINGADVNPTTTTFSNTSGNDYTINSAAAEAFQASGGISVTGSGNVTINSAIRGITAIDHDGAGDLALSGTNTFTGGVTVRSGATLVDTTAVAGVSQILGNTTQLTALTVAAGGSFDINGDRNYQAYPAASIKLAGAGVGGLGALQNNGGVDALGAFGDEINLTGDVTFGLANGVVINGALKVSGTNVILTKEGAGRLVLAVNNNATAANLSKIVLNAGPLEAGNGSAFANAEVEVNGGSLALIDDQDFDNHFTIKANTAVTIIGPGEVRFANGGKLTLDADLTPLNGTINRNVLFNGEIEGAGNLILGHGTTSIGGNANFTNFTGELRLNRNAVGASILNLNDGRTLAQTVRINDNTTFNESKVIGASSGSVTYTDIALVEDTDGVFDIDAGAGETVNVAGVISDDGNGPGVDIIGAGTVIFNGTNTYGNGTRVQNGVLLINGDSSGVSGGVTISSAAKLGGTGTIAGAISIDGGTLAPGESVGTLTTTGAITNTGTGTLRIDVAGATADTLVVVGSIDVTNLALEVIEVSPLTGPVVIVNGGATATVTGNFASVTAGYSILYNYNDGSDTNNIAIEPDSGTVYDQWAVDNGLTGGDALPGANPDMDALTNVLEFALGFDPQVPDGGGEMVISNPGPSGTIDVHGGVTIHVEAGSYYLRYPRRADFGSNDLTYVEQFAPDNLNFEDTGLPRTVIATGTGADGVAIEAVQVEFPATLPVSGRKARFGLLKVTYSP